VLQAEGFPIEQPSPAQLPSHRLTVLYVYGSLFFAAAKNLEGMLPQAEGVTRAVVILNLRGKGELGSTFMTVLQRYAAALHGCDSKLILAGVDEAMRGQLAKTGLLALIGAENVYLATPQIGQALNQAIAAGHAWLQP
jgi:SulP family sulfate permease